MSKEKSSKKSGCLTVILILIGILVLVFVIVGIQGAIDLRDSNRNSPLTSSEGYQITRETGFYDSFTSEEYFETLPAGTRVKPANNASSLDCRTVKFEGIEITSCWVEIIASGKQGWVLKNALRK
ncbi:hypothetical protein KJ742_03670 [Patescibacteria group bacterium]|nr:hypothetical protein [Patescibacteria group bacterium]MBU1683020.1 hypothetical protein [Patescibacteria group bacterium]MBU1935248.1 hypothetical protein [Patescibacteria group bacterium]